MFQQIHFQSNLNQILTFFVGISFTPCLNTRFFFSDSFILFLSFDIFLCSLLFFYSLFVLPKLAFYDPGDYYAVEWASHLLHLTCCRILNCYGGCCCDCLYFQIHQIDVIFFVFLYIFFSLLVPSMALILNDFTNVIVGHLFLFGFFLFVWLFHNPYDV